MQDNIEKCKSIKNLQKDKHEKLRVDFVWNNQKNNWTNFCQSLYLKNKKKYKNIIKKNNLKLFNW